MTPVTPQRRIRWQVAAVACSVCAALTLGVYLLGVAPLFEARAQQQKKREVLVATRVQAASAQEALQRASKNLSMVREAVESDALRLEPADRLNARLASLAELASANGLEIERIEPGSWDQSPYFLMMPIRVVGEGGFMGVSRFMASLHRLQPDLTITAFDLSGRPEQPAAPGAFELELLWYAMPTQSAASAKGD